MPNPTKFIQFIREGRALEKLPPVLVRYEGTLYSFPAGTTEEQAKAIIWNKVLKPAKNPGSEHIVMSEGDDLASRVAAREKELSAEVDKMRTHMERKAQIIDDFVANKGFLMVTDNVYYDPKVDAFWQINPDLTFAPAFGGKGKEAVHQSGEAFQAVLDHAGGDWNLFNERLAKEQELMDLLKTKRSMDRVAKPPTTTSPPKE